VKRADHHLELLDCVERGLTKGESRFGREVPEGVVAPVVGQSALDQVAVVEVVMDGQ